MEEAAWEWLHTAWEIWNPGGSVQISSRKKKNSIDVEDTASPRGLLLMDRDAVLSFMKRGPYRDRIHARVCAVKVLEAGSHMIAAGSGWALRTRLEGISRKSSPWVLFAPLPWRPMSDNLLTFDLLHALSNPRNRSWVSPLFTDAWQSPGSGPPSSPPSPALGARSIWYCLDEIGPSLKRGFVKKRPRTRPFMKRAAPMIWVINEKCLLNFAIQERRSLWGHRVFQRWWRCQKPRRVILTAAAAGWMF